MPPFDYNAPAELFLAKRTNNTRARYRRFPTAAEAIRYAVEDLRTLRILGVWMQVGTNASTVMKSSAYTRPLIIRCASLGDRGARAHQFRYKIERALFPGKSQGFKPHLRRYPPLYRPSPPLPQRQVAVRFLSSNTVSQKERT